jgi:hypothetical protein
MRRALLITGLVAALVLSTQALGAEPSPIRPPTAKAEGADLGKWAKRFFFYDAAIPVVDGSHPAFDVGDVDCSLGQFSRGVWLLETTPDLNGDFERRCDVPKGTTLYVPVFQWWCSEELDGIPDDECFAETDGILDLIDLRLEVDGVVLDDAALEAYRAKTGSFELPLVENSFWEYVFDTELDDSITFAADAFGALVGPFRDSEHVIVVSQRSEELGFEGSLTYRINVTPFKKG